MTFTETFEIDIKDIAKNIEQSVKDCISDSVNDEIWHCYKEYIKIYFETHEDEWDILLQAVVDELIERFKKYGVETW